MDKLDAIIGILNIVVQIAIYIIDRIHDSKKNDPSIRRR